MFKDKKLSNQLLRKLRLWTLSVIVQGKKNISTWNFFPWKDLLSLLRTVSGWRLKLAFWKIGWGTSLVLKSWSNTRVRCDSSTVSDARLFSGNTPSKLYSESDQTRTHLNIQHCPWDRAQTNLCVCTETLLRKLVIVQQPYTFEHDLNSKV